MFFLCVWKLKKKKKLKNQYFFSCSFWICAHTWSVNICFCCKKKFAFFYVHCFFLLHLLLPNRFSDWSAEIFSATNSIIFAKGNQFYKILITQLFSFISASPFLFHPIFIIQWMCIRVCLFVCVCVALVEWFFPIFPLYFLYIFVCCLLCFCFCFDLQLM